MCEVGVKSVLRSLRLFYKQRLADFVKARAFDHSSTAVEEMLVTSVEIS